MREIKPLTDWEPGHHIMDVKGNVHEVEMRAVRYKGTTGIDGIWWQARSLRNQNASPSSPANAQSGR